MTSKKDIENVIPLESSQSTLVEGKIHDKVQSESGAKEEEETGREGTAIEPREEAKDSEQVTIESPARAKTTSKTFVLKPKTDSERSTSRPRSARAVYEDYENLDEIASAQSLGINRTIAEKQDRIIHTLTRGDFDRLKQANQGKFKTRTYVIAVNLSEEAFYAIEWVIGTVLRTGDRVQIVFSIDKDVEVGRPLEGDVDAETTAEHQEFYEATTEGDVSPAVSSRKPSLLTGMKNMLPGSRKSSVVAAAKISAKEQDRVYAAERLSDRCIAFLRHTGLQVQVTIEVIHCKNARDMVTEAIDRIQPTLVVVGSRGRSLVKGAVSGSFSRYLIMKSSVPVMTARMRLATRQTYMLTATRHMANNIVPSKVTKYEVGNADGPFYTLPIDVDEEDHDDDGDDDNDEDDNDKDVDNDKADDVTGLDGGSDKHDDVNEESTNH